MYDLIATSHLPASHISDALERDVMRRFGQRNWLLEPVKPRRSPILRPAIHWLGCRVLEGLGLIGHGLRRLGKAFRREMFPDHSCGDGCC